MTVLIVVAVGLLFGAGALLLFRYQCQLRIDRQHEMEKLYAVRSVLNYIRTDDERIPLEGMWFQYHTGSDRDLRLCAKPVDKVFPDVEKNHFCMESESADRRFRIKSYDLNECKCKDYDAHYDFDYDYEYGAVGVTNYLAMSGSPGLGLYGLAFSDPVATNGVKWWVNIGMRKTGGWLQEEYGRRYCFLAHDFVNGDSITRDVLRLCIIRDTTNRTNAAGCQHGWPLSSGERALVLTLQPLPGGAQGDSEAVLTLSEFEHAKAPRDLLCVSNCLSLCYMGIQIAGDQITLFQLEVGSQIHTLGYTFFGPVRMSSETYDYFKEGCRFNDAGTAIESAPDLRAVFELEAASDKRGRGELSPPYYDFLTKFYVTPAYQYDVLLEYPPLVTNLATVAQKVGKKERDGVAVPYSVLTYDTHGTENKGFRKDERDFERERQRRNSW